MKLFKNFKEKLDTAFGLMLLTIVALICLFIFGFAIHSLGLVFFVSVGIFLVILSVFYIIAHFLD